MEEDLTPPLTSPTKNTDHHRYLPAPYPSHEVAAKVEDEAMEEGVQVHYLNHLLSFPPGYRFMPLDEELVYHYLLKKIKDEELPPNKIKDVNIYKYNPDDLAETYRVPEETEKELYFFTPRDKKYPNGSRPSRSAGDGYWKATGTDKDIKLGGEKIGSRKVLVFHRGKAPNGKKTDWIMHEYKVEPDEKSPPDELPGHMQLDKWVLCKIYLKTDRSPMAHLHRNKAGVSDNEIIDEDDKLANTQPSAYNSNKDLVVYDDQTSNASGLLYESTSKNTTNQFQCYPGYFQNQNQFAGMVAKPPCADFQSFQNLEDMFMVPNDYLETHNMGVERTEYYPSHLPFNDVHFAPIQPSPFNPVGTTYIKQDFAVTTLEELVGIRVPLVNAFTGEVPLPDF